MDRMHEEELNQIRFNKLKAERLLQIKREGILVRYLYGGMAQRSYFEFSMTDYKKATDLIKQIRFPLQICDENGHILLKFVSEQLYFEQLEQGKIFISEKKIFRPLQDLQVYYLVKRNSTNSVYKSIYSTNGEVYQKNQHTFSQSIKEYIEGTISEINVSNIIEFEYQQDMNQIQNVALSKVGMNALTFIKGPPGCGKTRTLSRLCRLLLEKNQKVIVGTVSNTGNISIMNLLLNQLFIYNNHQALIHLTLQVQNHAKGIEKVLIANDNHLAPIKLLYYTSLQSREQNLQLEPLVRYYSLNQYLIRNILRVNSHNDLSVSQIEWNINLIVNQKDITNKFYSIYMQALAKTVREAHIIVCTTVFSASINHKRGPSDYFYPDVAILDQAAQASWHDTFCFLKFNVSRLVLMGDENQLDPTVISQDKLLKETVFGKLSKKRKEYFVMLDTQYRMHPQIAEFPNYYFYNNQLKNGVTAQERKSQIFHFRHYPISFVAHSFFESQYIQMDNISKGKKNYYNTGEINIIKHLLSFFPKQQLKNVGIITPYSLQLKTIVQTFAKDIMQHGLTAKTCDGYQGGEKDYIIVSCVRSNTQGKIGFCGERNRTNVTLTRARRGLAIIGNMQTLASGIQYEQGQNVWAPLIQYLSYKNKIIIYQAPETPTRQIIEKEAKTSNTIKQAQQQKQQIPQKTTLSNQQILQKLKKLQSQIKEDEDQQDQITKLLAKNKKQVREIRKLPPFCSSSNTKFDPNDYLQKILKKFSNIGSGIRSVCKRMTKDIFRQLVSILQSADKLYPINELLQIIKSLDPEVYINNHIKQANNIYAIIRLTLFHKIMQSTQ